MWRLVNILTLLACGDEYKQWSLENVREENVK